MSEVNKLEISVSGTMTAAERLKLEILTQALDLAVKNFLEEASSNPNLTVVTTDCASDGNRQIVLERRPPSQAT